MATVGKDDHDLDALEGRGAELRALAHVDDREPGGVACGCEAWERVLPAVGCNVTMLSNTEFVCELNEQFNHVLLENSAAFAEGQ